MKTCKLCLEEKLLDQFSGQKGSKDGKRHQCKRCELERNRVWRTDRKDLFDVTKVKLDAPKQCSVCKEVKTGRDFYFDYTASTGLQTCCKDCGRKNTNKWQKSGKYGLLPGEFEEMLAKQRGLCGICSVKMSPPNIDHNHYNDEVRGLLCSACNKGLGHFMDDPKLLKAAIQWLGENVLSSLVRNEKR